MRSTRRYVAEAALGGFVVNLAVNALITWAVFSGSRTVAMWTGRRWGVDVLVATVLLTALTTIVVARQTRIDVSKGKVRAVDGAGLLARLPRSRVAQVGVALLVAAPIAAVLLAATSAVGVDRLTLGDFVVLKAVYCAALAAVEIPFVVLGILGNLAAESHSAA